MPKITVHGGPTNERAEPGDPGYVDVTPLGAAEPQYIEGEPSPGISSQTSQPKQQPTEKRSTGARPKRARTTGNRSKPGPAGSSTADSTDGPTPGTT